MIMFPCFVLLETERELKGRYSMYLENYEGMQNVSRKILRLSFW
jgi:hypothetical protein